MVVIVYNVIFKVIIFSMAYVLHEYLLYTVIPAGDSG